MSKTSIEWATMVWNPTTGCSKVSEGCRNCYAERLWPRVRAMGNPAYWDRNFNDVACHYDRLDQPLKWKKPQRIFVNSMSDLFHEDVPFEFIKAVWAVMITNRQHTYMILTKRPKRMLEFFEWNEKQDWRVETTWGNIWLGVSVENQATADERIPFLLKTPVKVKFISAEPLLGPISLAGFDGEVYRGWLDSVAWTVDISWVIVGGESGPKARPMHPDWVRSLRDQCQAANVFFFFKQWGEWGWFQGGHPNVKLPSTFVDSESFKAWMVRVGKQKAGRELDGRTWDEFPVITT